MAVSREFVEYVRDQLRPFGGVMARRMFGGAGLFRDGIMFGLVHDDTLYFRTDAANVGGFTSAGMTPFTYRRSGREVALGYFAVPAEVMDEPDRLAQWAAGAFAAAVRRPAPRLRPRKRA
jgi:DNA transformation protein and related proteins